MRGRCDCCGNFGNVHILRDGDDDSDTIKVCVVCDPPAQRPVRIPRNEREQLMEEGIMRAQRWEQE